MRHFYRYAIMLLSLLMLSCVKEIDLGDYRPAASLVVNCVAINGEPLKAYVSSTWFYTDYDPDIDIDNAKVELYVNGEHRETMRYSNSDTLFNMPGSYVADYVPSEGDRIRVEVYAESYDKAEAETTIPKPAELVSSRMSTYAMDTVISFITGFRASYEITLRDDPNEDNYYWIRLEEGIPIFNLDNKRYTGDYKWFNVMPDYSSEPVLGSDINALDEIFGITNIIGSNGLAFSDEMFSGKEYTLRMMDEYYYLPFSYDFPIHVIGSGDFEENDIKPIPPRLFRTHLYSISKDYYKYLKTFQSQTGDSFSNMLIDAGLAEPVKVYSNINGGIGIVGGCHEGHLDSEVIVSTP